MLHALAHRRDGSISKCKLQCRTPATPIVWLLLRAASGTRHRLQASSDSEPNRSDLLHERPEHRRHLQRLQSWGRYQKRPWEFPLSELLSLKWAALREVMKGQRHQGSLIHRQYPNAYPENVCG